MSASILAHLEFGLISTPFHVIFLGGHAINVQLLQETLFSHSLYLIFAVSILDRNLNLKKYRYSGTLLTVWHAAPFWFTSLIFPFLLPKYLHLFSIFSHFIAICTHFANPSKAKNCCFQVLFTLTIFYSFFTFVSVETLTRKTFSLNIQSFKLMGISWKCCCLFSPSTSIGRSKVHRSILVQFVDQLQRTVCLATFLMAYNWNATFSFSTDNEKHRVIF